MDRRPDLAARVVEAWALALSQSSFSAIADIRGSGNPDTPPLEDGTQTDHIRGVTRLAVAIADELRKVSSPAWNTTATC